MAARLRPQRTLTCDEIGEVLVQAVTRMPLQHILAKTAAELEIARANDIAGSALLQQARFIAFGRGESIESLKKFRDEYQLPIHFIADPTQHYYQQVTNTGIPRVVLLNAQHQVVKTFLGEIPDAMAEIVWPEVQ